MGGDFEVDRLFGAVASRVPCRRSSANRTLHTSLIVVFFLSLSDFAFFARYSAFHRIGNRLWGGNRGRSDSWLGCGGNDGQSCLQIYDGDGPWASTGGLILPSWHRLVSSIAVTFAGEQRSWGGLCLADFRGLPPVRTLRLWSSMVAMDVRLPPIVATPAVASRSERPVKLSRSPVPGTSCSPQS
ncbi:hypothetical protein N657DRAFT_336639 [Parathielavia appendiculata]|uniref:Uncharacterized protein n=1 Tax=Parathielavia appendiculata TaxID=2587402 RepID=A0AAN6U1R9_9PEZI|nr:hypothetical protein N657DRAFT_336639 [Parathielavia appendiculata]